MENSKLKIKSDIPNLHKDTTKLDLIYFAHIYIKVPLFGKSYYISQHVQADSKDEAEEKLRVEFKEIKIDSVKFDVAMQQDASLHPGLII